jgi:hypothetical protein
VAAPDPIPLVTADVLQRRYPELTMDVDPITLDEVVVEATANIEDRAGRRLAPFTNLIYEDQLYGIRPDQYGGNSDLPLDVAGALGRSYANAMGASDLVREFWLDQFAPMYPELWTYNVTSMQLFLTFGNTQAIDIPSGGLIMGPDITDGHCWLRMGTFAPEGSRIRVVYSGGYTVAVPASLKRACLFQAAKFLVLEAEPQRRKELNITDLDDQIDMLVAPWVRG